MEVPGGPLGVPGGVLGVPGGAPDAPKPPREASVNLLTGGKPVAAGLIRGGSGPPLKLLAKAKSDENERRQGVWDYGKRTFSAIEVGPYYNDLRCNL